MKSEKRDENPHKKLLNLCSKKKNDYMVALRKIMLWDIIKKFHWNQQKIPNRQKFADKNPHGSRWSVRCENFVCAAISNYSCDATHVWCRHT